ncbi:MAG TPA: hypothetical protein VMG12_11605, partial [Polyangiaceae bacterium]|nr:hypothetical protein [Polyangiaceae bacterium]
MSDTRPAPNRLRPLHLSCAASLRSALGTALLLGAACGTSDEPSPALPPFDPSMNMTPSDMLPPTNPDPDATPETPDTPPPDQNPEVIDGDVGLNTPDMPVDGSETPPAMDPPVAEPPVAPPAVDPPVLCDPLQNSGSLTDADVNVDLGTEFQIISVFGGMNMPRWIGDLTAAQADAAFGRGTGQLGLSMMRIGISSDPEDFEVELPTTQRVAALGVKIIATPWSPPANLKTNDDIVSGELERESYGAYADHLLGFVDFMAQNGVPIEAVSIQNEPDIQVDYDSCDWTPQQLVDFLIEQGPRFGSVRVMAPESFNF